MSPTTQAPGSGTPRREELRQEILLRVHLFPNMPVFVAQILDRLHDDKVDVSRLAEQLRMDPGVTANLLRLSNSAQFGATRRIGSLREAIIRLGLKRLFELVLAIGIARRLAPPLKGYDLRAEELLQHSLWTALAAEELCRVLSLDVPEMLFTAGLMHDLGKLLLDEFIAERKALFVERTQERDAPFDQIEKDILGVTHDEVGATILDNWRFPAPLVAAARWHHAPEEAGVYTPLATVVHIGEFLAYAQGVGTGIDGLSYRLSERAVSKLGLKTATVEYVASQIPERLAEMESLLRE